MTQAVLLVRAFKLIVKSGVCPETPIRDWIKILLFTHKKGYLWASVENNELTVIAAAYRVPNLEEKTLEHFPENEEGDILYVPWMASVAKDKMLPKKVLTRYLEKHPEVNEVAFIDWNDNEKMKRFKLKKEDHSGLEKQKSKTTRCTTIPRGSEVHAGT